MEARERLAANLTSESEAYGYTLTVWGGGAILISHYGMPTVPDIFAYVGGALLGFGLLAGVAFGALFTDARSTNDQPLLVTSMVHLLSTLGNLVVSYLVVLTVHWLSVPTPLVGVQGTVGYNVLLLAEVALTRLAARLAPVETDLGS